MRPRLYSCVLWRYNFIRSISDDFESDQIIERKEHGFLCLSVSLFGLFRCSSPLNSKTKISSNWNPMFLSHMIPLGYQKIISIMTYSLASRIEPFLLILLYESECLLKRMISFPFSLSNEGQMLMQFSSFLCMLFFGMSLLNHGSLSERQLMSRHFVIQC
jgi:hypothetical protein